VQRGSVMDTDYPGDPLTPGVGATADAKRLDIKDAKTPYKDSRAADFLGRCSAFAFRLAGPGGAEEWRGGLPITYHVGPGPAESHLKGRFQLGL